MAAVSRSSPKIPPAVAPKPKRPGVSTASPAFAVRSAGAVRAQPPLREFTEQKSPTMDFPPPPPPGLLDDDKSSKQSSNWMPPPPDSSSKPPSDWTPPPPPSGPPPVTPAADPTPQPPPVRGPAPFSASLGFGSKPYRPVQLNVSKPSAAVNTPKHQQTHPFHLPGLEKPAIGGFPPAPPIRTEASFNQTANNKPVNNHVTTNGQPSDNNNFVKGKTTPKTDSLSGASTSSGGASTSSGGASTSSAYSGSFDISSNSADPMAYLRPLTKGLSSAGPSAASSSSGSTSGKRVSPAIDHSQQPRPPSPADKSTSEAEVDALTDMLVRSMDSAAADPNYFGICAKCQRNVSGDDKGCTAMDKVYHQACFICVGCNKGLTGQSFYSVENSPHCEDCYTATLERCNACDKPVTERMLRAQGKVYHPQCFVCVACGKVLDNQPFTVDANKEVHCIEDFHLKYAPRCSVCEQPIIPEPGQEKNMQLIAMDRSFHVSCYKCEDCDMLLSNEEQGHGCYPIDGHVLCLNCNKKRRQQQKQ